MAIHMAAFITNPSRRQVDCSAAHLSKNWPSKFQRETNRRFELLRMGRRVEVAGSGLLASLPEVTGSGN
jgi:hypothetical protein